MGDCSLLLGRSESSVIRTSICELSSGFFSGIAELVSLRREAFLTLFEASSFILAASALNVYLNAFALSLLPSKLVD